MTSFTVRPATPADHDWISQTVIEHLGGLPTVTPSGAHQTDELPAFLAQRGDALFGLLNYRIAGGECEIVTLASLRSGLGIGTALIDAVRGAAEAHGCRRLWLVTTNDNLNALRFFQKRGFILAGVHRNAMEQVRALKPAVPRLGLAGIPLRDMLELEMRLGD